MDSVTVATGVWPATVLAAVLLTAVVTPLLLRAYRRATLRNMKAGGGAEPVTQPPAAPATMRPPLRLERLEPGAPAGAGALYARARASLRRLQAVYAVAGSAYVLTIVLAWMLVADDWFPPGRFLWLFVCYAWPVTLTLGLVGALGLRDWLALIGAYLLVLVVCATLVLARNPDVTLAQAVYLWLFANAVPSVLWLAVLNHRVRAVGPLVLTLAIAGCAGTFGLLAAGGSSDAVLRVLAYPLLRLGLDAGAAFALLAIVPFVIGIGLALLAVRAVGRHYRRKRISAQSMTIDCMWLLFALWQPITLTFEGIEYALAGPLGFLAYLLARRLGLGVLLRPADTGSPRILLLRVFALDRASRRLFDLWSRPWLRLGSISMISGPDLVTAAVEPHEFLAFLGGRLAREFISDPAAIDARLQRYDAAPDPDGNHRLNDFFCQDHTWRAVVERLARDADAVIMDLRSFRPGNDGCAWEIGQLLERVALDRVLLVVDTRTDLAHLERTLRERWERTSPASPNVAAPQARVRLLPVEALERSTVRRLFAALEAV